MDALWLGRSWLLHDKMRYVENVQSLNMDELIQDKSPLAIRKMLKR